jgi:hypothetical protein
VQRGLRPVFTIRVQKQGCAWAPAGELRLLGVNTLFSLEKCRDHNFKLRRFDQIKFYLHIHKFRPKM